MNEKYMLEAMKEALKAFKKNEIPVGCVVVKNDKIIGKGHNLKENKQNPLLHAEMIAIKKACNKNKNWRLNGCDVYVTMEPCNMCYFSLIESRIDNIFYLINNNNVDRTMFENVGKQTKINNEKLEKKYLDIYEKMFKKMRE